MNSGQGTFDLKRLMILSFAKISFMSQGIYGMNLSRQARRVIGATSQVEPGTLTRRDIPREEIK